MLKKNVTLFIAELQQKLSSTTQSFFEYLTVMVEYIRGCDHYNVLACTQIYSQFDVTVLHLRSKRVS